MSNTLKLGNGKWATGKDTVLAYNDLNSNYKPLAFSFSRASSATVVNKDGLIETVGSGEPRIDFKDNTKGALLLEPSRTNSNINSENFLAPNYNYVGRITRTPNAAVSPDGLQNAYAITETTDNGTHLLGQASWNQSISDTSVSVFAKANGRKYIVIGNANMAPSMNTWFDLENGVVGTQNPNTINATIEPYGNGWYRCSISYLPNKGNTYPVIYLSDTDGGSVNYQGDSASGVYLWGYQIEVNASYATSYIPTSGSAVTRVGESTSQTVPDGVIGQTEGTVFLDFKPQTLDGTSRYLSIENSNSVVSGWMGVFASLVSGTIRFRFYGDGWDIDSSLIIEKDTRYKIAFSYKNGVQTSIYVNGNLLNNITASLSGKSYQKIRLSEAAIGVRGDADFNDIKLYDTIKTDQELAALTQ